MKKSVVIGIIVVLLGIILITKLLFIQVIDDTYADRAKTLSSRLYITNPDRGLIVDRNGELIVTNDLVYDLIVTFPFRGSGFDTTGFCELTHITKEEFIDRMKTAFAKRYRRRGVFLKNLEPNEFARIQEGLYRYNGFSVQTRTDRKYEAPIAAHVLGYIAEISGRELSKDEEDFYEAGDYVGKSGIEQYYEKYLRGIKGREYFLVDRFEEIQGPYEDGRFDVEPAPGKKLYSSLSLPLQIYGEELMANKLGSIVAIEPSTGEVLAIVSSPTYDPSDFTIKEMAKNYGRLAKDKTNPLFNRAVTAKYAPGSIFKTLMALIGLEEGVVNEYSRYPCHNGFRLGGMLIRCHAHSPNPDLKYSIITSCNAYYCGLFRDIMRQSKFESPAQAFQSWRDYATSFGLGSKLGIDVNNESSGNIPTVQYYDRVVGEGRWKYSNIISISIGQGEIELTPLQMANLATVIANRGWYYTPHVIREIEGDDEIPAEYREKHHSLVSPRHFETVVDAMNQVTLRGTSAASQIPGIDICGKTGTVQNPHGKNHSVYMCFAPKDDPKIAMAVIVENSGYGSTYAAPIAHLMIEKYLHPDSTTSRPYIQQRILESDLIPENLREDGGEK